MEELRGADLGLGPEGGGEVWGGDGVGGIVDVIVVVGEDVVGVSRERELGVVALSEVFGGLGGLELADNACVALVEDVV